MVDTAMGVAAVAASGEGDTGAAKTPEQMAANAADAAKTPEKIEGEAAGAAKTPEQIAADEAKAKADAVPEKYDEFKAPEGVEFDTKALEAAQPLFKELGLSQEKAQKAVDFYAGLVKANTEAAQAAWDGVVQSWKGEAENDKEIGGAAFKENLADAQLFVKELGTPELMVALDTTGVGNHKEFIRAFSKAGKLLREGKIRIAGVGASSAADKPLHDRMYPDQGKA